MTDIARSVNDRQIVCEKLTTELHVRKSVQQTANFRFLFKPPIYPELFQVSSVLGFHRSELFRIVGAELIIQAGCPSLHSTTASKHSRVNEKTCDIRYLITAMVTSNSSNVEADA